MGIFDYLEVDIEINSDYCQWKRKSIKLLREEQILKDMCDFQDIFIPSNFNPEFNNNINPDNYYRQYVLGEWQSPAIYGKLNSK